MNDHDRSYLQALRPKHDPLHWARLAICGPGLIPGDRGCGLPTRWVCMTPSQPGAPRPTHGFCPVCGRRAIFAFWKWKSDNDYQPTPEQEADVRALYAAFKAIADGAADPPYGLPMEECIRVHCPDWGITKLVHNLVAILHFGYAQ